MKREVYWRARNSFGKPLEDEREARFLIVGGGITGTMFAYFLLQKGVAPGDIALIEARTVGSGSTGRSAGILVAEPENEKNLWWDALEKKYGRSITSAYQRANVAALNTIKSLVVKGDIKCEARTRDSFILAKSARDLKVLMRDSAAREHAGFRTKILRGGALKREFGGIGYVALEKDVQGLSVNPLALVRGIAAYLRGRGVAVYEKTPLTSVRGSTARTPHGSVKFSHIIYARGMGETALRMHTYVTTIALTKRLPAKILQTLRLKDADMFNDAIGPHPFHYGKVTEDRRLLLGYGDVPTKRRQSDAPLHVPHVRDIKKYLKEHFPVPLEIEYAWSAGYAITSGLVPRVAQRRNSTIINGAGIQISSVVAAEYAAAKLLGKKHALDGLWARKKRR